MGGGAGKRMAGPVRIRGGGGRQNVAGGAAHVAERADWDKNFPRLLEMYNRLVA